MKPASILKTIFLALSLCFISPCMAATDPRVISLVPSQTELLFHLGLGDHVAGISDYCNYPAEALARPRIGALELNIERIMSLRPALLVDVNNMHKKYALLFSQLGLNYVNFTVTRMDQMPRMAEELSKLLGKPEKGIEFALEWARATTEQPASDAHDRPTAYSEIWDTPTQAAGDNSYIGDMIRKAGGSNILADTAEFPVVNSETVLDANPDVIIIAYPLSGTSSIEQRPGWQSLRAVKNKQIHALDQDLFIRPGPRNLKALEQLRGIIRKLRHGNDEKQKNKTKR